MLDVFDKKSMEKLRNVCLDTQDFINVNDDFKDLLLKLGAAAFVIECNLSKFGENAHLKQDLMVKYSRGCYEI